MLRALINNIPPKVAKANYIKIHINNRMLHMHL